MMSGEESCEDSTEQITRYHCPYCDASFEYGTDRDKHMRECPGHPAAVRERQRIIEWLRNRREMYADNGREQAQYTALTLVNKLEEEFTQKGGSE